MKKQIIDFNELWNNSPKEKSRKYNGTTFEKQVKSILKRKIQPTQDYGSFLTLKKIFDLLKQDYHTTKSFREFTAELFKQKQNWKDHRHRKMIEGKNHTIIRKIRLK